MRFAPFASALLVTAGLAAASACSSADPSPSRPATPAAGAATTSASATPTAAKPRLVFFMNPNGMPCQVQDQILRGMTDLPAMADVVYLRTTVSNDLAWFDRFGIRSLPALVVVDATGREVRRGTPGIQSADQVRALLGR